MLTTSNIATSFVVLLVAICIIIALPSLSNKLSTSKPLLNLVQTSTTTARASSSSSSSSLSIILSTLSSQRYNTNTNTNNNNNNKMPNEQSIRLPSSRAPGLLADLESDVAVILTHPWGPLGGNMHNNVVVAGARYFQTLGISTLRFDFVGWQLLSWGTYQAQQIEEAAKFLLTGTTTTSSSGGGEDDDDNNNNNQRKRPTKILLVGYSYGSLLAASASANIPECVGVVSIAPPWSVKHWLLLFHSQHHLRQAQSRKELPKLFLIGDQDNFTSETVFLTTLETYFPSETTNTTGVVLPNVDHFFRRREKDVMKEIGTWLLKVFPKCQGDLKTLASGKVF